MSRPPMTDDDLRHLCKLASIGVSSLRDPDFIRWLTEEASERELADFRSIFAIVGDAFAELARRQGMLPIFRVPAGRHAGSSPSPSPNEAAMREDILIPEQVVEAALPDLFGADGENPMRCDNPGPKSVGER